MINGMIPPQALDLEEAILGALMIDTKGVEEVIDFLTYKMFYKPANQFIFKTISDLYLKKEPIDLLTVSNQLRKDGKLNFVGGDLYIIQLTQKIASSAHIEFHSRIIFQKYISRECITLSSNIIEKAYNDNTDVLDLLDDAYLSLNKISDKVIVSKESNFEENVLSFLKTANQAIKGIPSSLSRLDKKLNGYQNSDLIIVAARPGMGKTAFVLNEIISCGLRNIPVVFFSLEMSEKQIISRMLSIISGINIVKILKFDLTPSEIVYLHECSKRLSKLPISIDDRSGLSPLEIKIKCNKLKKEKGLKMVVVDYLQLMKIKNDKIINREQEISKISQSLKNIAKDLDVPVIALSQLSRTVESRGASKRPMLSDLRDSGSIEQDADIVMFIYRPEYYHIQEWDDNTHTSTLDEAEIDIAKYRNGSTGYCRVGCELKYMRFIDLEHKGINIQQKYFKDEVEYVGLVSEPKTEKTEIDFDENYMPF